MNTRTLVQRGREIAFISSIITQTRYPILDSAPNIGQGQIQIFRQR